MRRITRRARRVPALSSRVCLWRRRQLSSNQQCTLTPPPPPFKTNSDVHAADRRHHVVARVRVVRGAARRPDRVAPQVQPHHQAARLHRQRLRERHQGGRACRVLTRAHFWWLFCCRSQEAPDATHTHTHAMRAHTPTPTQKTPPKQTGPVRLGRQGLVPYRHDRRRGRPVDLQGRGRDQGRGRGRRRVHQRHQV